KFVGKTIPVGSIEFVTSFLKQIYDKDIYPINIPQQLMGYEYTKRNIQIESAGYKVKANKFIKSHKRFKGIAEITKEETIIKEDCLISDLIDIDSEWRAFIFNGKLLDCKN